MSELLISEEEYLAISSNNRELIAGIFGSIRQSGLAGVTNGLSNPTDAFIRAYSLVYNAVCTTARMMTVDWNVADSLIDQMRVFDNYLGSSISEDSTYSYYFCDNIWNAAHVSDTGLEFTLIPDESLPDSYVTDWRVASVNIHTMEDILPSLNDLERNIYIYRASLEEFSRIDCISGELADALKSYFVEVHGALLNGLADVVRTLYANLSSYCVSYNANFTESFYYFDREELDRNISSLEAAVNIINDTYPDIVNTFDTARVGLTPVSGVRFVPQRVSVSDRNDLSSALSCSFSTIRSLFELIDNNEDTGASLGSETESNVNSYLSALSHISTMGGYRLLGYQSGALFDTTRDGDDPYYLMGNDLMSIDTEGVAEVTTEDSYWLVGCVDEDGNFDESYADGLTTYLIDQGVDPDSISDGTFESLADVIHQLREAGYDDGTIAAMINNDLQGTVDMLNEYASAGDEDRNALINGLLVSEIRSWSDYSDYSDIYAQTVVDNLSEEDLVDLMNFISADDVTRASYSASERAHYLALLALAGAGYHEYNYNGEPGTGDLTFVGDFYGKQGVFWCAMYTTWCLSVCGYLDEDFSVVPGATSDNAISRGWADASIIQDEFRRNGTYHEQGSDYTPAVGDVVILHNSGHVGIVIGVDTENGYIYTAEGNASQQVSLNRFPMDSGSITGYCSTGGSEQIADVALEYYDAINDNSGGSIH